MGFLDFLFGRPPYPAALRPEVNKLIDELVMIGQKDDFLSERPGGSFNGQCRHIRARAIGKRLNEIGGILLMEMALRRVKKKLGANLSAHLEYAWAEIGDWLP